MENTEAELIVPKKLCNPVKDSLTRKELHRELLFMQKTGQNPLGQKSELQRVMESKKFVKKPSEAEPEFLSVHRKISENRKVSHD